MAALPTTFSRSLVIDLLHKPAMENIRQDLQLLRRKALECETAAGLARDEEARAANMLRAKLYRELIEEAEASLANNEEP